MPSASGEAPEVRGIEPRKLDSWEEAPGIRQSCLLLLPGELNEDDGTASGPKQSQAESFMSTYVYLLLCERDFLQRLQPGKQTNKPG